MTNTPETYITDEMRAYIGTETPPLVSPPITQSEIRRFVMAAYWPEVPPRRFWDEDYAKATRWGGIVGQRPRPIYGRPWRRIPRE